MFLRQMMRCWNEILNQNKVFCIVLRSTTALEAETAYITDSLAVGLHEGKSVGSPVVKIVSSGTGLDIIKQEDRLTYVRDSHGVSGWTGDPYLIQEPPTSEQFRHICAQNSDLTKRL